MPMGPLLEIFGSPAMVLGTSKASASTNHVIGRGAFRYRLKEDREDLWTKRK